jgi:hypothetical protein
VRILCTQTQSDNRRQSFVAFLTALSTPQEFEQARRADAESNETIDRNKAIVLT